MISHLEIILVESHFLPSTQKLMRNWKKLLGGDEIEYFTSTTDLWSSNAMKPYLGYFIHYTNKRTWEMHSACLQVHYTPEDHTSIKLREALTHTIEECHLNTNKMAVLP